MLIAPFGLFASAGNILAPRLFGHTRLAFSAVLPVTKMAPHSSWSARARKQARAIPEQARRLQMSAPWREPDCITIADVAVKIDALGKGSFERSNGLSRYVQKLVMLPARYKPNRENPSVGVIVELAYRGRRHGMPFKKLS